MPAPTRISLRAFWLACHWLLAVPGVKAGKIAFPQGPLRPAGPADLGPHSQSTNTYNEFWTFHFILDGDMQIFLNYTRANLGSFKSPVCGSDMSILGFRGRDYVVAREYPKDNFSYDEGKGFLRVHEKIWFQGRLPGGQQVHFETTKDGVSYLVDLRLEDISRGRVWGDGIFVLDGRQKVGLFIHVPYARVSGVVAVNGDTSQVTGTAYMDHTFQTDFAPALVSRGYRYISHAPPREVGYFLCGTRDYGSETFGYGLREKEGDCELLRPAELKVLSRTRSKGTDVATRLEIAYDGDAKALLEQVTNKQRLSVLSEFSGLTKFAIKKYMGGEIISFKGLGRLNGARPMLYHYFVVD